MKRFRISFRRSLVILIVAATLGNFCLVGGAIVFARLPAFEREGQAAAQKAAEAMSLRVEVLLGTAQERLRLFANLAPKIGPDDREEFLRQLVGDGQAVRAAYVLNGRGRILRAAAASYSEERLRELEGTDLSATPLFETLWASKLGGKNFSWSDKFISLVSGDIAVGVALPVDQGAVILEIPLSYIVATVKLASDTSLDRREASVWVVDRRGEIVVDTSGAYQPGEGNVLGYYFIREALYGHPIAASALIGEETYGVASARSELLGWIFVAKVPTGLDDRRLRNLVGEILILAGGSLLFGLLIAFLWALRVGGGVKTLVSIAEAVSARRSLANASPGFIKEFDLLAAELRSLGKTVEAREGDLLKLNAGLEERIEARTAELSKTNRELSDTLGKLNGAQAELVESQKLAALGQLVAGVAHELNTPLGNGLMAVSTISDRHTEFEREAEAGLRKSTLAAYLADVKTGIEIAIRNLRKAADLIGSFKQLAVDRTSDQRRTFALAEVVQENLLALHPQFKRTRHTVVMGVPQDISLDSYPGVLGQILTNLVNNALIHAFDEDSAGTIRVAAELRNGRARLEVIDDGKGIPEAARSHIFEPFFTTRMGKGGSGLGLHIVHNQVRNILGGTIEFSTETGSGTRFILELPLVAPDRKA